MREDGEERNHLWTKTNAKNAKTGGRKTGNPTEIRPLDGKEIERQEGDD